MGVFVSESTPISKARQLRRQSTDAERRLLQELRNRQFEGYEFRRQSPVGPYIADFVCWEQRLIVELDGSQHQAQSEDDQERTEFLASSGYRVIRFRNDQLFRETQAVLRAILSALQSSPSP